MQLPYPDIVVDREGNLLLDCDRSLQLFVDVTFDFGDEGIFNLSHLNPHVAKVLGYMVPIPPAIKLRVNKENGDVFALNGDTHPSTLDLRFEGRDRPFQFMIPVGEMIIGTVTIK